MEHNNSVVAEAVRRAIQAHGTSDNAVALAIGIPRTTFYRRVTGHSSFTAADLIKIADHLGIDARDLLPAASAA